MSTKQKKLQEFNDAKNALLNYYSGVQVSLGTRLLGFAAIVFTLFQVASWSPTGLSAISTFKLFFFPIKLILFWLAVFTLILYMVRTAFRYASVSEYLNTIITLEPLENIQDSPHASICAESYQKMVKYKVKVFFFFPFNLFFSVKVSADTKLASTFNAKSNFKGWVWSVLIALSLSAVLFWTLQEILFK
jgi:hypothetical protein